MSSRSKLGDVLNSATRYSDIETVGIANAMERIGEAAPAVVQLQSALFAGIVRSQRREAERSAKLDNSLQSLAADARAERFEQLQQEFAGLGSAVLKLVEGQTQPGTFHGFVFTAEGKPAVDYRVELTGFTNKPIRADTDETGYFRMTFARPADPQADGKPATREAEETDPFSEAGASPDDESDKARAQASVTVSNPAGRALFSDPTPPTADESGSIFRYYPLPPERPEGRAPGTSRAKASRSAGGRR